MHFEMPVVQDRTKLPTQEEVERYIKNNNVSESGKYRVEIKTKKFDRVKGSLEYQVLSNQNVLDTADNRPLFDGKFFSKKIEIY